MGFPQSLALVHTTAEVSLSSQTLNRPSAGDEYYRGTVLISNSRGAMEAPDSATIYVKVVDTSGATQATTLYDADAGTELAAQSGGTFDGYRKQATALGTGRFEFFVKVASSATEAPYTLEGGYTENGVDRFFSRNFRIGDAADLDDILADTADMQPKLGTPAGASISADIASVQTEVDKIGTPAGASVSADIATMDANVDAILVDTGTTLPATLSTIEGKVDTVDTVADAILVDTGTTLPATLGTPAGASISADIAAVDTVVDAILVDTGTTLPATLGTPAGASLAADIATVDTVVDGIQTDLSNATDGLGALKALIDTVDTVVDGIQTDLDNGTDGLGALKALIDTVDTVVDAVATDLGDFSGAGTNLLSLQTVIGTELEAADSGISLADALVLGHHLLEIAAINTVAKFPVTGASGDWAVSDTVTGGTSLQTATLRIDDSSLGSSFFVSAVSGTFTNGETITNGSTGTATLGTAVYGFTVQKITGSSAGVTPSTFGAEAYFRRPLFGVTGTNAGKADLIDYYVNAVSGFIPTVNTSGWAVGDIVQVDVDDATYLIGDVGSTNRTHRTLTAAIGAVGAGTTDDSLFGYIGDPTDAAVANDGSEGSLFAKLRSLATEAGAQAATFTEYVVSPSATVLSGNPQQNEISASSVADAAVYEIMHVKTVVIPEGTNAAVDAIYANLRWTSQGAVVGGSGTGDTKWVLADDGESATPGNALSTITSTDVTTTFSATTSKATHQTQGQIPTDAIPASGGFLLILAGKVDTATDTLTSGIYDESNAEITYKVS